MKKIYQPREILEDLYWTAYEHTHSPSIISEALEKIDDWYKSKELEPLDEGKIKEVLDNINPLRLDGEIHYYDTRYIARAICQKFGSCKVPKKKELIPSIDRESQRINKEREIYNQAIDDFHKSVKEG